MFQKLPVTLLPILIILLFINPTLAVEEITAEEASAKYNEAVGLIKRHKYSSAIELLNEIVEAGIDDKAQLADALNMLGFSYRKNEKLNFAIDNYSEALRIDPTHKGANEYVGEAYLKMNKPLLAVKHLKILENICGKKCVEYQNLKKSFDLFLQNSGKNTAQY